MWINYDLGSVCSIMHFVRLSRVLEERKVVGGLPAQKMEALLTNEDNQPHKKWVKVRSKKQVRAECICSCPPTKANFYSPGSHVLLT